MPSGAQLTLSRPSLPILPLNPIPMTYAKARFFDDCFKDTDAMIRAWAE
jgi:hypothetical protein